jgi:zinc and cadmium transporter
MTATVTLIIYSLLVIAASLIGGQAPVWLRLTHTRMQIALSFVGGAMLAVALLHLMPHSFYQLESLTATAGWMLGGFLVMFFIERAFHFHHHDSPLDDSHEHHDCQHEHEHAAPHNHGAAPAGHAPVRLPAVLIGLSLHSVLDGVALAAGVLADVDAADQWTAGLSVFLIILMHKPFDSLALGTLLAAEHASPARVRRINVLYALTVPIGVALFLLGVDSTTGQAGQALGIVLACAAGMFLCIASSDLLPELQFHTHDRGKLSAALLLGIALAAGLVMLEESRHDHGDHEHGHGHQHHEH